MRKHIAKFVPVVALAAIVAACNEQVTHPGESGAMPVDTLLNLSPVDTFASVQAMPVDTFASAQAMPIDTFASAQAMPVDTLLRMAMPIDTLY